ncbi:DUF1015 domain-containing protein [Tenacibaculum sp. SG-28]|uniref:DUF1015 domain-containing protein n=1 Tax=Tenacibaculum sp. SG-28 TaxID=754426 RepID=UPI000CF3EC1B|nr:DUF1015 domain-containing protein [Tenacibaculum sp. SG-28]PQJ23351.1 hypothetical protein BSU00_03910 [Tenacibaculum sp. SG-28]
MAIVKPFRAVRATKDKVALVSSKSFEVYTPEELHAKLTYNPFSFLHVINPGYKYHHKEISGEQRFKMVHNRYLEFKEDEYLIQDETPAFYIYKKVTPVHVFIGIIAATSVHDFHQNKIKKHEATLRSRELLFEEYLKNTGFNAEPVLLTYPENPMVNSILEKYQKLVPEYEFTTTDKNLHTIWPITNTKDIATVTEAFKDVSTLYIADGHHRSTSSCILAENLAKNNASHTGEEPYNYFMSYLLSENQLCIYEFNRFIKDLNGLSPDEFLIELDTIFKIENKGEELFKPLKKHQFCMYLNGSFYALTLRKSAYKFTDKLSKLDAQILFQTVLKPILGIHDIRNSSKIIYSQNKSGGLELKTKVDEGTFKVSFGMLATNIKELKEIIDDNLIMPPKTTYIEPKLRSALTIYEFL